VKVITRLLRPVPVNAAHGEVIPQLQTITPRADVSVIVPRRIGAEHTTQEMTALFLCTQNSGGHTLGPHKVKRDT